MEKCVEKHATSSYQKMAARSFGLWKISIPQGQVSERPHFRKTWVEKGLYYDTGLGNHNMQGFFYSIQKRRSRNLCTEQKCLDV